MHHSTTLFVGLDVHRDPIAVPQVGGAGDAEVVFLGRLGSMDLRGMSNNCPSSYCLPHHRCSVR